MDAKRPAAAKQPEAKKPLKVKKPSILEEVFDVKAYGSMGDLYQDKALLAHVQQTLDTFINLGEPVNVHAPFGIALDGDFLIGARALQIPGMPFTMPFKEIPLLCWQRSQLNFESRQMGGMQTAEQIETFRLDKKIRPDVEAEIVFLDPRSFRVFRKDRHHRWAETLSYETAFYPH